MALYELADGSQMAPSQSRLRSSLANIGAVNQAGTQTRPVRRGCAGSRGERGGYRSRRCLGGPIEINVIEPTVRLIRPQCRVASHNRNETVDAGATPLPTRHHDHANRHDRKRRFLFRARCARRVNADMVRPRIVLRDLQYGVRFASGRSAISSLILERGAINPTR